MHRNRTASAPGATNAFLRVTCVLCCAVLPGMAQAYVFSPTTYPYAALSGEASGGSFGSSVASAGDVNGDGYDDVIVGDWEYDSGRGRAYIYFGGPTGHATPDVVLTGYNISDNFGYSVASAGDVNGDGYADVLVGAPNWSGAGVNAGRVYVYLGGPAMDNVPDTWFDGETAFSYFGYSVAPIGDINHNGYADFIIGAYGYDSERGRVYVCYGWGASVAVEEFKITGRLSGERFGFSVASAGDVNGDHYPDFLVGAPAYASLQGRAFLFLGSAVPDTTEDQVFFGQYPGDWFGTSVCSAGDTDGDGYSDILVGAPNYDSNRGRAYLFRGAQGTDNVADVTLTGENVGDYFGLSVASAGDGNRDGKADFLVGAPGFDSFNGKVYYYYETGTSGNVEESWNSINNPGERMGWSVAGAGDVDGDGYADIIYGDPGHGQPGAAFVEVVFPYRILQPNGGEQWVVGQKATVKWLSIHPAADVWISTDGGAGWSLLVGNAVGTQSSKDFYEYDLQVTVPGSVTQTALLRVSNGTPITQANSDVSDAVFQIVAPVKPSQVAAQTSPPKVSALGPSAYDTFGVSLAGAGDWNGDGFADVAVAAPSSPGRGSPGHVYLYEGGPGAGGAADLVLNGESADDEFGAALAFPGDLNGDGYDDLAVGAPLNDGGGVDAGRVYVYFGGPSADGVPDLTITGPGAGLQFGNTVSRVGDVNGDGVADLLVGTAADAGAGETSLFLGGAAMDANADLTLSESPGFGTSAAGAGDVNGDGYADIIIGSPSQSGGNGQAFVYYGGASLDPTADLVLSGGTTFGQSVAGAGDLNHDGYSDLIVGEPGSDRAVVFFGGPSLDPAGNVALSGVSGGQFGLSVAGAGDVNGDAYADVVVGEPFSSAAGPGMGRALVFFGGPAMDAKADMTIATTAFGNSAYAGFRVASAGDFLGDGFPDLLVGAPGSSLNGTYAGAAGLYDVNRFQLVTPNGGGTWEVGSKATVSWYGAERADLLLSLDGGKSYSALASNVGGEAFNSLSLLVPHAPTKFARVKLVPNDLSGSCPDAFPPSPATPPSPCVAGSDQSDSLFTINAGVALLSLLAAPAPDRAGAVITWNTDPGPQDLQGYRLEKAAGSGSWQTLVAMTKETRAEDPLAGPATRYRLFSVNGLGEELMLGETAFRPRQPLAAWPLPYRAGKLSITFATAGGLGGAAGPGEVGIFDVQGRLVRRIASGTYPAGYEAVQWDGRDGQGREVSAGVYLLRAMSGGIKTSMKIVVAR
jgi:hypothetical protein